jgi:hypothetical protein
MFSSQLCHHTEVQRTGGRDIKQSLIDNLFCGRGHVPASRRTRFSCFSNADYENVSLHLGGRAGSLNWELMLDTSASHTEPLS